MSNADYEQMGQADLTHTHTDKVPITSAAMHTHPHHPILSLHITTTDRPLLHLSWSLIFLWIEGKEERKRTEREREDPLVFGHC